MADRKAQARGTRSGAGSSRSHAAPEKLDGMTVQELAAVLERADGDLVVEIPPQPHEPDGNLGFRVTGHSVGAGHLTLHIQGRR